VLERGLLGVPGGGPGGPRLGPQLVPRGSPWVSLGNPKGLVFPRGGPRRNPFKTLGGGPLGPLWGPRIVARSSLLGKAGGVSPRNPFFFFNPSFWWCVPPALFCNPLWGGVHNTQYIFFFFAGRGALGLFN